MSIRRQTMTIFGIMYTISTSAMVLEQGITTDNSGMKTAKICLDKKEKISFKVGINGIEQSYGIEESKGPKGSVCYTKTYSPGVVSDDQYIYAVINQSSFLIKSTASNGKNSEINTDSVITSYQDQSLNLNFNFPKQKSKVLSVTVKSVETNEFAQSLVLRYGTESNTVGEMNIDLSKLSEKVKTLIIYNDNGDVVQNIILKQNLSEKSKNENNGQTSNSESTNSQSSKSSKKNKQSQQAVNQKEIIEKASQSAERFAKQFALAFGAVDNIKYNFYLAKREMNRRFGSIGNEILIQSDVTSGEIKAVKDAQTAAEQVGLAEGQADAKDVATDKVINQWQNSVGKEITPKIDPSVPEFKTKNFRLPEDKLKLDRVDQRLEKFFNNKGVISQLILDTQKGMDTDLKFAAIRNTFYDDISQFQITESFYSSDYMTEVTYQKYQWKKIFELWVTEELTDANSAEVQYFKSLEFADESYSDENRQLFKSVFLEKIESVLQKKWKQIVTKENKVAQSFAEDRYLQAIHEYSYDYGYVKAYQKSFQNYAEASYQRAFRLTYPNYYSEKFEQIQKSPMLGQVSGYVMSRTRQATFGAGEDIYFSLQSAVNFGGSSGVFAITTDTKNVSSNGKLFVYPQQNISISKRNKINQEVVFKIAQIGKDKNIPADGVLQLNVMVGDRKINQQEIRIQWEKSVMNGITFGDAAVLGYLRTKLYDEYKSIGVTNNDIYVKIEKLRSTLFYRMKNQLLSLNNPNQKAYAVKVVKYFQTAYGARPSGWFDTSKDDYDSLMKEYSQLLTQLSR